MRIHRLTTLELLRRLGWPGLLGAVLLGFAAVWSMFAVQQGIEARERAAARVQEADARLAAVQRGEPGLAPAPERLLQDFRDALPGQPAATADIDRLYVAAEAERISLARGEYALVVESETALARYQILLPVRATYPQVRRFLANAMASLPALGLEDLDLQRKQVADTELEGRIRMTLYLSRR
jgi:hypothetical protein